MRTVTIVLENATILFDADQYKKGELIEDLLELFKSDNIIKLELKNEIIILRPSSIVAIRINSGEES